VILGGYNHQNLHSFISYRYIYLPYNKSFWKENNLYRTINIVISVYKGSNKRPVVMVILGKIVDTEREYIVLGLIYFWEGQCQIGFKLVNAILMMVNRRR